MNLPESSSKRFKLTIDNDEPNYHVAWTPPTDYSWKLHFSSFVADHMNGNGSAAFILHDENALLKVACAFPIKEAENIYAAKLMALRHGLEFSVCEGVDYLEVEGDCSMVFRMLSSKIKPSSPAVKELIADCLGYIKSFRCFKKRLVNIFSNDETEPVFWFDEPPPQISESLIEDVIGRKLWRD